MNMFDVVALKKDLPNEGLVAGARGAVVEVYLEPEVAYEVEFSDADGNTVAQLALTEDMLEKVDE
ncbi:MAG: DUF4926 domain-containing protein [Myxococcota bacterium]